MPCDSHDFADSGWHGSPYVAISERLRLCYCPRGDGEGFLFGAVLWLTNPYAPGSFGPASVRWDGACIVRTLLDGRADTEGIACIMIGDDGYLHEPSADVLARVFAALAALERLHCREVCVPSAHERLDLETRLAEAFNV